MVVPFQLREAAEHIDLLPAIPQIAQKIMALQINTDEGESKLLKLIEQDPQIAAKIIGLANTPLIGPSKRVTSVADAAMLLGLNHVKVLALGIAVMSVTPAVSKGKFDSRGFWQHSMTAAFAMKTLARAMPMRLRPREEEAFLSGLLHDMGYIVLNHLHPELVDMLMMQVDREPTRPVQDIESEVLETTHEELGELLAHHWELPDNIRAVIKFHHEPKASALDDEQRVLVSMVYLIERLLPVFGIDAAFTGEVEDEYWQALSINPEQKDEICVKFVDHAREVARLFS
ncbi:MAG: HDOD domain-containing protein [Ferrovum sp.]|nr:HDOD domain-containing protein [Ferrovum sp.]NDU87761.1 HDOD domain-containing protein [Ferrovum sp.]